MIDVETANDFRCGHNFQPAKCPYKRCGYRSVLEHNTRMMVDAQNVERFKAELEAARETIAKLKSELESSRSEHLKTEVNLAELWRIVQAGEIHVSNPRMCFKLEGEF